MSTRIRLTARGRSAADQTPYPGNVNQPDRSDPAWDEYHTFEQRVNHELPDMRHDWQNDGRDDIGFGIPEAWGKQPTVASLRVAANKAIRVAVLLLGDKVGEEIIEAQARDLMAMGPKAMDRTMQRFAETQKLYAADEADKVEEKVEDKKAADEKVEDKKEDAVKASDLKALVASAVAEAFKAALPDFIQKKVDEKKDKEDDKKAAVAADEKDDKVVEKVEDKKAADVVDEDDKVVEKVEDKKASATKTGMNEFDIELTGAMEDEVAPDAEADERLASLFDNDGLAAAATAGNSTHKVEASQKSGIKKLGGQPRVASAEGAGVDISSIWQSAPDVSEAFK